MTYSRWHREARQKLEKAGHESDEAHALARLLLDHVTGKRYAALQEPDTAIEEPVRARLQFGMEKLCERVPFPHLTGNACFWGRDWHISPSTLIPRPETEFLVEAALKRLQSRSQPRVIDLGTGSGIVSITLARELKLECVWATEISASARQIAANNAKRHGVNLEMLEGVEGDWLAPLGGQAAFSAIVSNPPYIATHEIEALQPEVRIYEPRAALDGGADGLEPYRQLAAGAREFLDSDGFVAVELGATQFGAVRALFEIENWRVEPAICDLAGFERVLVAWPNGNAPC